MNKILRKIKYIFALTLIAGFTFCSSEQNTYLQVIEQQYTLFSTTEEVSVISVTSEKEWDYSSHSKNWIVIGEKTDNTLSFTVLENESSSAREGIISISSEGVTVDVKVTQLGTSVSMRNFPLEYGSGQASPDGNYIVFGKTTETGILIARYHAPTDKISTIEMADINEGNYYPAISNDGNIAVNGILISTDGTQKEISIPSGHTRARIGAFAADGSAVGYVSENKSGGNYIPVKWDANGNPKIMPLPTDSYHEGGEVSTGAFARGCSDDGSIIYGGDQVNDRYAILWTENGTKAEYIGQNNVSSNNEHYRIDATNMTISANGNYLSIYRYCAIPRIYAPAIYNVTTKEISHAGNVINSTGGTATNAGELIYFTPAMGPTTSHVRLVNGSIIPIADWFYANYGFNVYGDKIVEHVADNGNILGRTNVGGYYTSFVIVKR